MTLVISLDDYSEKYGGYEEIRELHQEFPDIKITLFAIPGDGKYLAKAKADWTEIACHSAHSGASREWSKEEAIASLMKHKKQGFAIGYKAPGWRLTQAIRDACNETGFWLCHCYRVQIKNVNSFWITWAKQGFKHYESYSEFYCHVQDLHKKGYYENLKAFCREHQPNYKFISEAIDEKLCAYYS